MTRIQLAFLRPAVILAAGIVAGSLLSFTCCLAAESGPGQTDHPNQAPAWSTKIQDQKTILTLADPGNDRQVRSGLVALPAATGDFRLEVLGSSDATVSAPSGIQTMRGLQVLPVLVEGSGPGPVSIAVHHDGSWGNLQGRSSRLASASLHNGLALPERTSDKSASLEGGSYLIVYPPAFSNIIAPLVDWKTRKGYEVFTISTGVTGASSAGILAYLQEAYDTWDNPPEYILLFGDVGEIPTYSFYGNPSDFPYVLLDGDDWFPDAMIGRIPVENDTEARTLINKIVGYERTPYLDDGADWFTRSIMVGGVEGSDTPPHTVRFCGEQLQKIGFAPAQTFLHPPLPSNMLIANMFNPALDDGASIVAYRGWAYGTSGWSDPRYEVNDMGGMDNHGMLPVVMSFVCLNGDYTASSPCFGEAFLRQGLPEDPKGAIAFIGNGEHWSHTRFNDAMAISFFERIISPEITDLGGLMNAGKLRFLDYFPNEIDADTYGEESVEFYFHIYNLLGDPELNFWKSTPLDLAVDYSGAVAAGTNSLDVTVTSLEGGAIVPGATVAATRDGELLSVAVSDEFGAAQLVFPPLATGEGFALTVTGPGLFPHEGSVAAASVAANVTIDTFIYNDGPVAGIGNGDGVANPGETISVSPAFINNGTGATGAFTLSISSVQGPGSSTGETLTIMNLDAGQSTYTDRLDVIVQPDARDGDTLVCTVDAVRAGDEHDLSVFQIPVFAPDLTPISLGTLDQQDVTPGQTFQLALTLLAEGSVATTGGTVTLALVNPEGALLTSSECSFTACQPGATVVTTDDLTLQLDTDLATGTNLSFVATINTDEGYSRETSCGLVVGPVDVTTVSGPDNYGYYAYDSADLDYPANRPHYVWNEISTAMGGTGTRLNFPVDNEIINVQVDLPFNFSFYGQEYSRIRVSDNGWIAFDLAPDFNFYNWPMPSEHGNNAKIAPYWENLVPVGNGGSNGIEPDGIYFQHDPLAGTFTVEWSRLHHYKPQILGLQTFQVVLLDPAIHPSTNGDGEMLFFYRDVINNDHLRMYATVGIEDMDGRDGLQLSYASLNAPGLAPLQPGLAIRISTEKPVRVPFALSRFTARNEPGGVRLDWAPADDRPVLGWFVDHNGPEGTTRLNTTPLAPGTRSFTAPANVNGNGDSAYKLTALHPYGAASQPGQVSLDTGFGLQLALHRASPNPSHGSTRIAFAIPEDGTARLRVYDAAGRLVRTLVDGQVPAGEGLQIWDGRDDRGAAAAGGIYFFRLETRGKTLTRKLILVR